MRPVVSYDDITLPYEMTANANEEVAKLATNSGSQSTSANPPLKKRKKSRGQNYSTPRTKPNGTAPEGDADEYLEVEESRELTNEEIWDDSALIEAWNAATEEYEAYNGPDKGWKNEPVHKSPLWYNFPPSKKQKISHPQLPSVTAPSINETTDVHDDDDEEDEGDSHPINFDTFVPSHDPGLDLPMSPAAPGPDYSAFYGNSLPDIPGPMVSQDEAFSRALGAMYWGGYWTAVYHCHKQMQDNKRFVKKEEKEVKVEIEDGDEELDVEGESDETHTAKVSAAEDFVSTQR